MRENVIVKEREVGNGWTDDDDDGMKFIPLELSS
jgi:hypothetical protein